MKKYESFSEKETGEIAEAICRDVGAGSVVAFRGGLGMGKTAFVRGALKAITLICTAFPDGTICIPPAFLSI